MPYLASKLLKTSPVNSFPLSVNTDTGILGKAGKILSSTARATVRAVLSLKGTACTKRDAISMPTTIYFKP
jgi:hypothetical protein